jgi:threonine-phosphate decarboxylase
MTIVHGGNVYELAARAGCSPEDILDYSASINPLGPPPGLNALLASCFHRLQHYPDIRNQSLIGAVAQFHDIAPECVAVGNGSTELIYWLPQALGVRKALTVLPTFGEYAKAFELMGVELQRVFASPGKDFQPDLEQLEAAFSKCSPDAVLLTHPGSPAGSLLDRDVCEWIAEKAASGSTYFLMDEVFVDFCENKSLKRFLAECPNLAIIRSLTKFYGLPGLRIGYLLASPQIIQKVRRHIPPWSVNTLAQTAGAFCLKQDEYRLETLNVVEGERKRLIKELSNMPGLKVFPGEANYLLVHLGAGLPPASLLKQELFGRECILIRDCGSFEGMDDRYFRIAVRLHDQNDRLIEGLRKILLSSKY